MQLRTVLLRYNLAVGVIGKIVQVIVQVLLYLVIIVSIGLAGVVLGSQLSVWEALQGKHCENQSSFNIRSE
jgi:hypothetical protein